MDLLYNLLNAIINFKLLKWEKIGKRIERIDVLDYAVCLVDYIKSSEDTLDNDFLFMSKFAIDYLINNPLMELIGESKEEKIKCLQRTIELEEKSKQIGYAKRIGSFDEFIASLYFPLVETGKDAKEVISRNGFYNLADDLYRMMRLAVARPNDKLLRYYNKNYKARKLAYIKMIAEVVIDEYSQYKVELDAADKQFMELCNMINKYLEVPVIKEPYYDTSSAYFGVSMNIMRRKIKENNE